jgi:hypothetical protein
MTDDPTVRRPGEAPEDGADERDERLAALLAVPPLEDHTRTRLVRRALDEVPESTPRRSRRALPLVAAATLLVVAVTGGLLLASGDGGPRPTATRAVPPPPATESQAPTLAPGSAAALAPRDLGAVGDVTATTQLRRAVTGPPGAARGSLNTIRDACGTGATVAGVTRFDTVGTGVDAGQPAAIIVGRDTTGRRVAVVVTRHGCRALQRLPLG